MNEFHETEATSATNNTATGTTTGITSNKALNGERREFIATPIFQHQSEDSSTKNDEKIQSNANISANANANANASGYRRKVIDRIVTPIPFDVNVNDSDNNDRGEIEVCIEEYYQKKSTTLAPLLRRVAVRPYTGITEESDVGVLHATFSLTVGQLPHNIVSEMLDTNIDNETNGTNGTNEAKKGGLNKKNWLCWTTFKSSHDKNEPKNDAQNSRGGKTYLCVLTGPSTLKIFDVYPKRPYKDPNSDGDSAGAVNKGEGHTISLPFEASSIFPLPSPYRGLLIQRADNGDEEFRITQFNETYYPNIMGADRGEQSKEEGIQMGSQSPIKDDVIIEGPPSTVRLGLDTNMPNYSNYQGTGRPQSPASSSDSELGNGVPTQIPISQMAPSLYTLHHPLDDILPCVISPSSCSNSIGRKVQMKQQAVFRKKIKESSNMVHHFANVYEQVIFVGKPRSFIPINLENGRKKDEVIIIVTYNTQKKRHAFWILGHASPPTPKLPLWQQTSNNLNIGLNNLGSLQHHMSESVLENMMEESKANDELGNIHKTFSPLSEIHARVSMTCIHLTSHTLSEENATDTLSSTDNTEKIANEVFLATTAKGNGDFVLCLLQAITNPSNTHSLDEQNDHVLRRFKLELLESNQIDTKDDSDCMQNLWHISDTNDIKCLAAQPIHSTPINPPSFSPLDDSIQTQRFLAEWRTKFALEPPMAVDIIICRYSNHKTKLSLFRDDINVADCTIPSPPESSRSTNPRSALALNLKNAVGDCVDILYGDKHESYASSIVRVALSLFIKSSPVTEKSLLAIGSSMLPKISSNDSDLNEAEYFNCLSKLSYTFRADFAIFSQLASTFPETQDMVDDVEWYVFSLFISVFFSYALNKASTWDILSTLESDIDLKQDIEEDDDQAWEDLLQSDFHSNYFGTHNKTMLLSSATPEESKVAKRSTLDEKLVRSYLDSSSVQWLTNISETDEKTILDVCTNIFDSLHLLYEEMKVSNASGCNTYASLIGNLLYRLSSRSIKIDNDNNSSRLMADFLEVYTRDLGVKTPLSQPGFIDVNFTNRITKFCQPPCFLSLLERVVQGEEINSISNEWRGIHVGGKIILNGICSTMGVLFHFFTIFFDTKWESHGRDGMRERDRCLVMAMIQEGFTNPFQFLGTFPLSIAMQLMEVCHRCRSEPPPISNSWSASAYDLVGRADLAKIQSLLVASKEESTVSTNSTFAMNVHDSTLVTQSLTSDDQEKDGLVSIEKFSAMLFPNDNRVREGARLLRSSRPTFLRVQRSVEASDHDYERQKQDKLSLLCRRIVALPLGRGMMTYGTLDPLPAEPLSIPTLCLAGRIPPRNATLALDEAQWTAEKKIWPEFHNGVAAGLRLTVFKEVKDKNIGEIARTWIVYNKPLQSSPEPTQNNSNQSQSPPTPNHAYGGFLMALGLRGHLSALLMTDICDYLMKGSVTTAVGILLGMAANKRGSCDLSVSKMLCLHIPSLLPGSFLSIDFASPIQTAAVAGIGLLYQGSSHRLMTEFLLNEIGKRPTNEQNISDRESYTLCCGIALGMVNLGLRRNQNKSNSEMNDDLSDMRIEERLLRYIVGGVDDGHLHQKYDRTNSAGNNGNNESERCSRIYEGDMINIDVTAPGATFALGMIYLQSGNKSMAAQLDLPDTHFSLDNIRPDFLFLNVVARSLILWDEVEGSSNWIENQVPAFIQDFYTRFRRKLEKETESEDDRIEVDTKAMKEAHAFIIAGACFSLGLRFAGTGDEQARDAVFEKVVDFQKFRDESVSISLCPQRPVVEMCLGSAAISLSLIMAGTGDLKTLRLLKMLRWRCDDATKYGTHMSFGAAIGMLFLGGGACTLGRGPEDIAALLMAFFPRFPMSTQDNQYHLQALRHMYSLAVKQRRIEAIDIDSREKIFVPIKVDYDDFTSMQAKTPCLLMNRGQLSKIRVTSDRYYPVEVDFKSHSFSDTNFQLFVKKRSGRISYMEDPYGLRSDLFQSVVSHSERILDLLNFTSEAQDLQVYARYLCKKNERQKSPSFSDMNSFGAFCSQVLCESLLEEKTDSVPLQLALYDTMVSLQNKPFPIKNVWDLRLLRSFYEEKGRNVAQGSFEIISPNFVATLCQRIDQQLNELRLHEQSASSYGNHTEGSRWLGPISVWFCKPVVG